MESSTFDVVREIELDAPADEVWQVVSEAAELSTWLGDVVELDVTPGGRGRVVDGGVARTVVVDDVEPGQRLAFRWWDDRDGEAGASRVVITVVPTGGPTRLVVRETPFHLTARASCAPAARSAAAALRWDVRLVCLAVMVGALARV